MIFNVNIQTNSEINFKEVEIEDLTDDNCLFLDELDKDQFNDVIEAVKTKFEEIINERFAKQGLKPVFEQDKENTLNSNIEDNNDGEIEENNNQENTSIEENSNQENNEDQKEIAKSKIISSISKEMGKAQDEGRTYSLEDLMNLEIPDSSVSVFIVGDEATINIDGFDFKINSNFELYE